LQKEEELRSQRTSYVSSRNTTGSSQPVFRFQTLMTGVWGYDPLGKLSFDRRYKDLRAGSIIFGKTTLVIYLESMEHQLCNWHGRIDIPYAILEHTVPSVESGQHGSITLTLKSPPKIYQIVDTDDLHLYTEKEPIGVANTLPALETLGLRVSHQNRRLTKLERLCGLQQSHDRTSALCMVYKVLFPNLSLVYKAWAFLKDFSVPEIYCWKTMAPQKSTRSIENDFAKLERTLALLEMEFAVQFQVLALVLEGTLTPEKMGDLVSHIWSMSRKHGSSLTALALKSLGRQIPTPGPHINSSDFDLDTVQTALDNNLLDAKNLELACRDSNDYHKQREHLASTYKATITPTGE
jgi:hypothetical protein